MPAAESSDRLRSIGFICDDIDSTLTSALITLQMAVLNQLLKYESLTSGSVCDSIGSKTNYAPNVDGRESNCNPLEDLDKIRSSIALMSQSVTRIVSSVGVVRVLRELAVNDKELISTLLHGCEVELRLTHNADMTCDRYDSSKKCGICEGIHYSDEDVVNPSSSCSTSTRTGQSSPE